MLIDVQFNIGIIYTPAEYNAEGTIVQEAVLLGGCHCNALYSGDIPESLDYALLPEAPGTPTRVYAEPLAAGVFQGFLWWPTVEQAQADLEEAGWNFNHEEEV